MDTSSSPAEPLLMGLGYNSSFFGPELGFGWELPQHLPKDTAILLIKTAWNAKSLSVDFRPPSAGLGNYTNFRNEPIPDYRYGAYYRHMMEQIHASIHNLDKLLPNLNDMSSNTGNTTIPFEIKGLVWFQGWSDQQEHARKEYASNLAHLIHDVRHELNVPELPIVIGELSQVPKGPRKRNILKEIQRQQQSVAEMPEFYKTTLCVKTNHCGNRSRHEIYGVGYHYFGHADIIYEMGQEFARDMLQLGQSSDTVAT